MPRELLDLFEGKRFAVDDKEEEGYNVDDHRNIYTVEKYTYHECLIDDGYHEGLGGVSLWGGGHYFADIHFIKPDEPNPREFKYNTHYDHDFVECDVDMWHRDGVIDLLRNEGPVKLYIFHDGTPERKIKWAWIGTDSCAPEEVGEGEG